MLLAVRISSYGCTWEVWRALKKLELLSAAPRATLTLLSCSPNFPRASITRYTHAKHEPILNCFPVPLNKGNEGSLCDNRILAGHREAISVLDVAKSNHFRTKATKRNVQTLGWPKHLSNGFSIICYISCDCQLHSFGFWWVIKTSHD